VRRDDWPFGPRPWPLKLLAEIKSWRERTLQPDLAAEDAPGPSGPTGDTSKLTAAKTQNYQIKNQRELAELAEYLKKLHSVEECQQRRVKQVLALKTRLLALERTVPHAAGVVGDEATRVAKTIREQVEEALKEFAQ
jgi:hypothetical protein